MTINNADKMKLAGQQMGAAQDATNQAYGQTRQLGNDIAKTSGDNAADRVTASAPIAGSADGQAQGASDNAKKAKKANTQASMG